MLNHYIEPEKRISGKEKQKLKQALFELVHRELDKTPLDSSSEYQVLVRKLIIESYEKIVEESTDH